MPGTYGNKFLPFTLILTANGTSYRNRLKERLIFYRFFILFISVSNLFLFTGSFNFETKSEGVPAR